MNPMIQLLSMTCTYTCFIFSIHWIKIPDGYQIAGLKELGLWSTSQSSLWIWSLRLKIGVNFPLSILWGYFPFTNTLCNKYCLLILPLFVAICEIWLPGLTYSMYLVLPLKPGATAKIGLTQIDEDCKVQNLVWVEMDERNPIVREQFAQEWMCRKAKSPMIKILKND